MIKEDLVWYVGYGSNVLENRFLCYITGGTQEGSQRVYEGCRDKSLPQLVKPIAINYELYFSKNSSVWQNGGVAFIRNEYDREAVTYARMFLISKEQLSDIAKQETSSNYTIDINFDEAIEKGSTVFKALPSWYGKILLLGYQDDLPIFTLTSEIDLEKFIKPSSEYLKTISMGLRETYNFTTIEITDYFQNKKGVLENYKIYELYDLVENRKTIFDKQVLEMVDILAREYAELPEGEERKLKMTEIEKLMRRYYGEISINNSDENII